MTTQEYLEQITNLDKKIDSRLREREAVKRRLKGGDATEESVQLLKHYIDTVNGYVDELLVLQVTITDQILQLNKFEHQLILRERYLHNKKWEDIADEHFYSRSRVYGLHDEALEEFGKLINN